MKNFPISFRPQANSGIILLIVLWILAILTILAIGLGRRASIDMALTGFSVGQFKAEQAARAGVPYAFEELKKDKDDPESLRMDTLLWCGLQRQPNKVPEDLFKDVPLGDGVFEISYTQSDMALEGAQVFYGFQDEERRINLNGLTKQNDKVLRELIVLLGFEPKVAQTIASSVIDWHDADSVLVDSTFGAENDYYLGLGKPYRCKNSAFENIEELRLVRGVTPEIYSKMIPYVTVYPRDNGQISLNLNTAPVVVLRAFFRSGTGAMTQTTIDDAESLVNKIISLRRGEDGILITGDDRPVSLFNLGLNAKETALYNSLLEETTASANYFRIHVKGRSSYSRAQAEVEAIVRRDDFSIVSWRRP